MVTLQQSFATEEDIQQSLIDQPQFTPIPTPTTTTPRVVRGGSTVVRPPQQSFATEEDIQQSLIDQPQFTPIPTPTTTPSAITITSQLQEQAQQDFGDVSLQTRIPTVDQPSIVGLPRTFEAQALSLGREERRPSARFTPDLFKTSIRQFFGEGGTPITAAGTLASPIQGFFPRTRGEDFFIPKDLKISDELKIQTKIERQREQALADPSLLIPADVLLIRGQEKISKELVSELQPQVTSGQLTIEQAEKKFQEEFLPRFEKQTSIAVEKRQEFISEFEKGRKPAVDVPAIAELVAIGAGSFSPVGQALIGASFVAEGIPKLIGGETLLERGLGLAEIGLGLGGGSFAVKTIERQADRLLVKELQAQRGLLGGKEVARFGEGQLFLEAPEIGGVVGFKVPKDIGRGSIFETRTIRGFGKEAKIITELRSPVFQTGKDAFSITGGKGKSTLEFFSIEKGKPIKIVEQFKFGGRQVVSQAPPKSIVGDLRFTFGEDVTGSFGKGFIQRKGVDEFTQFGFGGISKEVKSELGTFTRLQSGKVTGLRLEGVKPLRRGGLTFKSGFVKIPISEEGAIKKLVLPTTDFDIGFIQAGKGSKTSFATTFQQIQAPPPIGISKVIEKQIFKAPITTTADVSKSLIGIPRFVGGSGLTQQQIQRDQGLVQQEFSVSKFKEIGKQQTRQKDIFSIGQLDRIIQGDITRTLTRTLQIPQTKLEQRLNIKQIEKQFQITELELTKQFDVPTGRTIPFDPFGKFDFGRPRFPFPSIPKEEQFPRKGVKGKRARVPIRPSFTGIVLEIETGIPETTIIGGIDIGILPGQIRGIAKRKKTKKIKKKKVSKKKRTKKRK